MHFLESCEKSLPKPGCCKYHIKLMMDDDYGIPTTSRYFQQRNFEGADSSCLDDTNSHYKESVPYLNVYMREDQSPTESEGNISTRTSKKNGPYTHNLLKIKSSCNISQELASTVYEAPGSSVANKKTALKKVAATIFQETKPLIRNENRVMFMEQGNYGKFDCDQYLSQGSSCSPPESYKSRGQPEVTRQEKTTNCRPVPNVHCKEVTSAAVERNARLQKLVRKIAKMRQKERQAQKWNSYIESLKYKHKSEAMDNNSMRTDYINKRFTDEMSGTDVMRGEYVRVSVRRSQATSVTTTPPFDPDMPGATCCQNVENTMPYNFNSYGFYPNQPCFYPVAFPSMPQYPQYQQFTPPPQQIPMANYQFPSQELKREITEATETTQYCNSNMSKTNNFSSICNKRYLLVHTAMQTNTDFGIQAYEWKESETNTDEIILNTTFNDPKSDSVIAELRHMSKNIEKLKKKGHVIKAQEASLTNIEEKLDTLLHSINSFMAKLKSRAPGLPCALHDETTPTCSSCSVPTSNLTNNKGVLACSRTAPNPRPLSELSKKALTSTRTRPPRKALTCDKSILICSRTLPPRATRACDKLNINTSNKIVATRSEPYRVPQLEEIVCNVMASAGDSFTINEEIKRPSSSRSKLDIIRSLLEEIENNRVTRDTDNAMNREKRKRGPSPVSRETPRKECWTVTDSLSMTPLLEQKLEEVCLQSSNKEFFKYHHRPGSSNSERRIMSIAVNTEPLSIFSLFRISKDALKQVLSYMPQIDSLLPRYLDSFFCQPSNRIPHFDCNICGAAFMRPSQLSDHIQSHNLGAVKNCCVCRHVLDTEQVYQSGLFPCRYCGQHFTRAYCCQLHQQTCARLHGVRGDAKPSLVLLK